jgi:hypothetical protein
VGFADAGLVPLATSSAKALLGVTLWAREVGAESLEEYPRDPSDRRYIMDCMLGDAGAM